MRETIALPLATNNLSDLADGLERTARLSPDMAWESWRTIASQGAAAARKGDINRARAACKACHDTWREAYKAKFRKRPIQR
jgi:cytochrome c556